MRIINKYLILIVVILFTTKLYGQAIFDTLQLNELEVLGVNYDLKSPTKVVSIDSLQRNEMELLNIAELISTFTPIYVKSYGRGSIASVSFRGTGASHTKVVWDGFDINSPMLGQTDLSIIPVSLFSTIELKYGGGSLSDVSGALGGSIILGSKGLLNIKNRFSIHQSYGSFNTFLTTANLTLSGKRLGSQTNFSRQSSDNNFSYFNNAILPSGKEMNQANAGYVFSTFSQQFDFKLGKNQTFSLATWNNWSDRDIPTTMTNVQKGGDQTENMDEFFSRNILSWQYNHNETMIVVKGAYFVEDLGYFLRSTDSLGNTITSIDSRNNTSTISVLAKMETRLFKNLKINAGSKYTNQLVNSNNYSVVKKRTISSNHISLLGSIGSKINYDLLARMDIADGKLNPVMPMLGINFKPMSETELYLRTTLSRNYNLPTLNDLYWYPGGNDTLLPEESYEAAAEVEYYLQIRKQKFEVSITGFSSVVNNWIVWQPGEYRYWSPVNVAKVNSSGIEVSTNIELLFGSYKCILFSEYTFNKAIQQKDGYIKSQLMYVPENIFNGFLSLQRSGYYINWGINFTGERTTTLDPEQNFSSKLPAFTLNNATIGKLGSIKKVNFDIRFKIYNVFDVDYQAVLWRAMPGRNYELSLKITL